MSTPKDYAFKYDVRQVDPLSKLREGEPWFFLRAQDRLSGKTLQCYADLLKQESEAAAARGESQLADELLKQALGMIKVCNAFLDWQLANPELVKLPD